MKFFFVSILTMWAPLVYCQDSFHSNYKLIKDNIQFPFETLKVHSDRPVYKDSFFIDHIVNKYSGPQGLARYISNKYYLKKFVTRIGNSKSARMVMEGRPSIQINISVVEKDRSQLGVIELDSTDFNGRKTAFDFKYVKSVNSRNVFGFSWDTTVVTCIGSMRITLGERTYEIDPSLLDDLFFPSLCETYYAFKPVEAYLSPDNKNIYIYISGGQKAAKYFCKIIFDLEGKKAVGRIIADNKELSEYQCLNTSNFIGF